jgi:hypothetical protein
MSVGVLVATVVLIDVAVGGVARSMRWEIPAGMEGWVLAQFADPACPALGGDGIFVVAIVGADGRACTSSDLPRGWQYTLYDAVGPNRSQIDKSLITFRGVDDLRRRVTFFVGPANRADPRLLPPGWR